MDPVPVVAGDAHREHDPPYEVNYGEVVRPVYERVERAERIRDALAAAGHPLVEPAADAALTAADLVASGAPAAYALCRPPGHHAGPGYYGGFCLLNNAAIAARSLATLGRVAVVDIDFHHGNGTQDVFWEDPEVLYASLHGDPAGHYPHFTGAADETGGGAGAGTKRNLPLPDGPGDDEDLAFLAEAMGVG